MKEGKKEERKGVFVKKKNKNERRENLCDGRGERKKGKAKKKGKEGR